MIMAGCAVLFPAAGGVWLATRPQARSEIWDRPPTAFPLGSPAVIVDAYLRAVADYELLMMDCPAVSDMSENGHPLHDDGIWEQARREFRWLKAAGRITAVPGGWKVAGGPEDSQKI